MIVKTMRIRFTEQELRAMLADVTDFLDFLSEDTEIEQLFDLRSRWQVAITKLD